MNLPVKNNKQPAVSSLASLLKDYKNPFWLVCFDSDLAALPKDICGHVLCTGIIGKDKTAGTMAGVSDYKYGFFQPDGRVFQLPKASAAAIIFIGLQIRLYRRFVMAMVRQGIRSFTFYDHQEGWITYSGWRLLSSCLSASVMVSASKMTPKFVRQSLIDPFVLRQIDIFLRAVPRPYQADSKQIVHCNNGLAWGGAERQLVMTLEGLHAAGYQRLALVCDDISSSTYRSFFLTPVQALGVPIHEVAARHRTQALQPETLLTRNLLCDAPFDSLPDVISQQVALYAQIFAELRPAVVHAWQDSTNIIVALAALAAGVPKIVMAGRNMAPHHFAYHQPYMKGAYKALLKKPPERLVFLNNSRAGRNDYAAWLSMPASRIDVILNGFDVESWSRSSTAAVAAKRAELGIPADAPIVGSVFRFYAEKDPHLWLDVVDRVARTAANAYFVVFGDGPLLPEIKQIIQGRPYANRIILPGDCKDSELIHSLFDVFLLCSRFEGTPNVLIEAALTETPIVATAVGGVADTVSHGVTGFLSKSRNTKELADFCLTLLQNPAQAKAMGAAGRTLAIERFSRERMISETLNLYGFSGHKKSAAA